MSEPMVIGEIIPSVILAIEFKRRSNMAISKCPHCGVKNEGEWHRVPGGFDVCQLCLDNYFTKCDGCGIIIHRDDVVVVTKPNGGKYGLCEECKG